MLGLIAEGLTNYEIARQLFISNTTVDTHRKILLSKLGAKNTASLIRIAAQLKLVWRKGIYSCQVTIQLRKPRLNVRHLKRCFLILMLPSISDEGWQIHLLF